MAEFVLTMPDVGEGVAEAELVEWNVKPGDLVHEDMVLAAVMTDKATVEIPSPVAGVVTWLAVTSLNVRFRQSFTPFDACSRSSFGPM